MTYGPSTLHSRDGDVVQSSDDLHQRAEVSECQAFLSDIHQEFEDYTTRLDIGRRAHFLCGPETHLREVERAGAQRRQQEYGSNVISERTNERTTIRASYAYDAEHVRS